MLIQIVWAKRGDLMDLRWLDDVLILLEEKNMTSAAARRNITQPAFSRRIRGFENWLGSAILQRGTNKIEISPALFSNEKEIRALVLRLQDLRSKIADFNPASSTCRLRHNMHRCFPLFPIWRSAQIMFFHRLSFACRRITCAIA